MRILGEVLHMTDLEAASEQMRLNFLQTNLELCFTFADLIETQLRIGDVEVAQSALEKAEAGYANVARLLPDGDNADDRNEIELELARLRARLDSEQIRMDGNRGR
jgi:hypothetical protein